jgi:hypothetical protein
MQNEIHPAQWSVFCKEFSRQNEARPTRVEIFGELGAQTQEEYLPLAGLSVEDSGRDAPRLEIILGGGALTDPRHVTHAIPRVKRLLTKQGADGRVEASEIEDESGTKTVLQMLTLAELSAKN